MFLPFGFALVFAFTTSLATGEESTYKIIEMADAQPFKDIPCPESCDKPMSIGMDLISQTLGSILKKIPFELGNCKCIFEGMHGFTYTNKCFMNEEKTAFDHSFEITLPNLKASCECDFSNNPSKAAEKINNEEIEEGQCGAGNYKNTFKCNPLKCDETGEGESHVKLAVNLTNSRASVVVRVDSVKNSKTNATDVFPIKASLITDNPIETTQEGPEESKNTWKCLAGQMDDFFCHLVANAPSAVFECLSPNKDANIVNHMLYAFGKCNLE